MGDRLRLRMSGETGAGVVLLPPVGGGTGCGIGELQDEDDEAKQLSREEKEGVGLTIGLG